MYNTPFLQLAPLHPLFLLYFSYHISFRPRHVTHTHLSIYTNTHHPSSHSPSTSGIISLSADYSISNIPSA